MRFKTCVVPAAGLGLRTRYPDRLKCLLEADGKSLLEHTVRFWSEHAEEFVIVVREGVSEIAALMDRLDVKWGPAWQRSPEGMSNAIMDGARVAQDGTIMVALADCLFDGRFDWPPEPFNGLAVKSAGQTHDDWERSYAVSVKEGEILGAIEKPILGLGAWFFKDKDNLEAMFAYSTPWWRRVIGLRAVSFTGEYMNVTYGEDLNRWGI